MANAREDRLFWTPEKVSKATLAERRPAQDSAACERKRARQLPHQEMATEASARSEDNPQLESENRGVLDQPVPFGRMMYWSTG